MASANPTSLQRGPVLVGKRESNRHLGFRALTRTSARNAAYRRISARISIPAVCCPAAKYPGNKLIYRQPELGGRPNCHEEGRGFQSLQPLHFDPPALRPVGPRGGKSNHPPHIPSVLGTSFQFTPMSGD